MELIKYLVSGWQRYLIIILLAALSIATLYLSGKSSGYSVAKIEQVTDQAETLANELQKNETAARIDDALRTLSPADDIDWMREHDFIRPDG